MTALQKTHGQTRMVLDTLRSAIITGRYPPDTKLNIAALATEIAVSAGAVREGLAMLEAEALVVSEPARGYRVSPVSLKDLRDLVAARIEIEKLCLAESIKHGDLTWEGGIVAAFHRLSRIAELDTQNPSQMSDEWAASHAEFHRALVCACPNVWLLKMHHMLYQQSERYRKLAAPLAGATRDVKSEHQALMDAVLTKNVPQAQAIIVSHLNNTAAVLMGATLFSETGA